MSVLKIDEKRFELCNKDLFDFNVIRSDHHIPRGRDFWINTCIKRLKYSHTLKLELIKEIVESIFDPKLGYYNMIKQIGYDVHVSVYYSCSNIFTLTIIPKNE